MRHAPGFTLIEILIVVGLVAVMAAVTVPTVAGAMNRYYILSAGQQVVSTIRTARFQAVARNSDVRIRFDFPAAGQYQTEIWDEDDMAWGSLGQVQYLSRNISFGDGTPTDVEIEPTGRPPAVAGCPCTIIVSNGNADDDRTLTISTSGRIQLQ